MEAAVTRLERVAERLEKYEASLRTVGPLSASTPAAAPAAVASSGSAVAEFDHLLSSYLDPLVTLTASLGAEEDKAIKIFEKAVKGARKVVDVSARAKQPDDVAFQQLLQPVSEQMMALGSLTEGKRTAAFNHFKVLAESVMGLSFLAYTGPKCGMSPPRQHVAESWNSAEFFANKIMMEHKGKNQAHVDWVRGLKDFMGQLEQWVARNAATGLKWNPSGVTVQQALAGAGAQAAPPPVAKPAVKAGGPPPPPPPPAPPSLESLKAAAGGSSAPGGGGDMSALFKELQKGEAVTSGLRKVTDDMKAKNRTDRSGVVSAAPKPSADKPAVAGKAAAATGPPRFELEKERKWVVENQVGRQDLVIKPTDPKQSVYIFGCKDAVVQIKGKINALTMDSCSKTGVVFEDIIASCELVNCKSVQLQCTKLVPTISVEKTDGCQLFLPQQVANNENFQIVSAKCSEVNVVVVSPDENADSAEHPIPEQFVSTFKHGKLITVAAAHSAA